MKPRHIAMGVALVLAAGLVVFGDRSPEGELAEAVERPGSASTSAPAATRSAAIPAGAEPVIGRLVPRETLIGDGADRFGSNDHTLFGRQDWTPPPPPPPKPAPPPPPPPPMAPPLPFTVIGKSLEDGKWAVYLAAGERTHIASVGDVLDGGWRVDRIAPPFLTLTYLPLNQVQQLNIGVFE